jgi:hypothetical protein
MIALAEQHEKLHLPTAAAHDHATTDKACTCRFFSQLAAAMALGPQER